MSISLTIWSQPVSPNSSLAEFHSTTRTHCLWLQHTRPALAQSPIASPLVWSSLRMPLLPHPTAEIPLFFLHQPEHHIPPQISHILLGAAIFCLYLCHRHHHTLQSRLGVHTSASSLDSATTSLLSLLSLVLSLVP